MAAPSQASISGIGGKIKDFFANRDKVLRSKTGKPNPRDFQVQYKWDLPIDQRVLGLADYHYREGSFEKIQFARKWMRNALIYQGYHELEWSEINVAWDIIQQDSGDFAFPNNYYRTLILQGVRAYLQNEPIIEPVPSNDDGEAQAATKAAKTALDLIKQTVKYDYLRVKEAINLRLFGNSFRYSYYSKDPRYGYITSPVYQDRDVLLSPGGSVCPGCGPMEGNFLNCPGCGTPITDHLPPVMAKLPGQTGNVRYPRGELMTEDVNPLEIYLRSSSYDLWHAPFLVRNRVVDRLGLQSAYPDINISPKGDEGGGEAYSTGGDLGLIYLQSLADLPGDPTQYAAWYERATAAAKALLIEVWLRPTQYFFDKELIKKYPDGLYIAKTGDTLLEARADAIEDHWSHYVFNYVPGRIWGDGDDDIIPQQLKLDETDRLILRNQGYNSVPMLAIDSQRIDKSEIVNDPSTIIEVKPAGKPVSEAYGVVNSQPLSQETWQWRTAHLSDMQFHSRISPTAVGMHEPGVNTFGGQESMAAKSDNSLLPNLVMWKTADELWARQVLKLASENWIDERVQSVFGINGKWEFTKLRGSAIDMDRIKIITRVMPIDPSQQDAMSQAVASGALDPQDPRVKRKMMELFHLPREIDATYDDQKVQWEEIELMKQTGQLIQPELIVDNDALHIDACRNWLNSDEGRDPKNQQPIGPPPPPQMGPMGQPVQAPPPTTRGIIKQHMQMHVMNQVRMQQMAQMAQQGPGGDQGGQPGQSKPEGQGEDKGKQAGKHGGQSPENPVTRQQRAQKGQAAKPHRPQPSSGNQHHVTRQT
jgi:hypothetical protein